MTPKEQYEARKAARRAATTGSREREAEMLDMLDRFVTAVEQIGAALESRNKAQGE